MKESNVTPFLNVPPFSSCSRGEQLGMNYISHHVRMQEVGIPKLQAVLPSVKSETPSLYVHLVLLLFNVHSVQIVQPVPCDKSAAGLSFHESP